MPNENIVGVPRNTLVIITPATKQQKSLSTLYIQKDLSNESSDSHGPWWKQDIFQETGC